jgi:hypothetical protein
VVISSSHSCDGLNGDGYVVPVLLFLWRTAYQLSTGLGQGENSVFHRGSKSVAYFQGGDKTNFQIVSSPFLRPHASSNTGTHFSRNNVPLKGQTSFISNIEAAQIS